MFKNTARFVEKMRLFFEKRDISNIKTKHVLLAVVGMLFLFFYIGLVLSGRLYPFRMMVFTIVLFLMGLYGIHRFTGERNRREREDGKKYAGHIGLGALLSIIFFVGIQIQQFKYYYLIGIVGMMLFLPAIRDVMKQKKRRQLFR